MNWRKVIFRRCTRVKDSPNNAQSPKTFLKQSQNCGVNIWNFTYWIFFSLYFLSCLSWVYKYDDLSFAQNVIPQFKYIYPSIIIIKFTGTHLYTLFQRGIMGEKGFAQEHDAVPRSGIGPGQLDRDLSAWTIKLPRLLQTQIMLQSVYIFYYTT